MLFGNNIILMLNEITYLMAVINTTEVFNKHKSLYTPDQDTDSGPRWVAQLVGASSCAPKGCAYNSQSEYLPRLQVQSPVGEHMGSN